MKGFELFLNCSSRRCLLLLTGALSFLVATSVVVLTFAADWLHVKNVPVDADAAIVLAGDPSRAFYAADIFNQGHVQHIYISKAVRLNSFRLLDDLGVFYPRQEEIYRQVLLKKGVPDEVISLVGSESISTADEALVVQKSLPDEVESLLVITSPYHIRRVEMIFNDALPGITITVLATPYEEFPDQWWKDQNAARNVLLELSKIIFYQLGGRFHSG